MIRNLPFVKDLQHPWTHIFWFSIRADRHIMRDLEWQGHCAISRAFVTLFGICCWLVVLMAILYTLDEQDMENFIFSIRDFLHRLSAGIQLNIPSECCFTATFVNVILFYGDSCHHHHTLGSAHNLNTVHVLLAILLFINNLLLVTFTLCGSSYKYCSHGCRLDSTHV